MKAASYFLVVCLFGLLVIACSTAPKDQNNTRVNIPDTDTTAVSE